MKLVQSPVVGATYSMRQSSFAHLMASLASWSPCIMCGSFKCGPPPVRGSWLGTPDVKDLDKLCDAFDFKTLRSTVQNAVQIPKFRIP